MSTKKPPTDSRLDMFAAAALQGILAGGVRNYNKPDETPIKNRKDLAQHMVDYEVNSDG